MILRLLFVTVALICTTTYSLSADSPFATPDTHRLRGIWPAEWIAHPTAAANDYGVYLFRKHIQLDDQPTHYTLNISADNRYRLMVNGTQACWGPARGDLNQWYYETVDIASLLHKGDNVLAVEVWNPGSYSPTAQISLRTGLIVQGNSPAEDQVNSNASWRVVRNEAYEGLRNLPEAWYAGGTERIDGNRYPWGWEQPAFDDSKWEAAAASSRGKSYGAFGYGELEWVLTPRDIPQMELTEQRIPTLRRFTGIDSVAPFINGHSPWRVPPHTTCSILLDRESLTTAYPELIVSGGVRSSVRLTYAEAMFDDRGKANRNAIDGRTCHGYWDEFVPDGGSHRLFRPLWMRTFRYMQVDIQTADQPLIIEDLKSLYTGYPFEVKGMFGSDDPSIDSIWEVGWRTARLCAHETYFDCPYYEQLQYAGDTRIQALISLYVSGDDRLVRKAIRMYDLSRSYEGITASRYPSNRAQYIPPFSLYWIAMVHDYWMLRTDESLLRSTLPGVRSVLGWFTDRIDPRTGLLNPNPPHWNFTDWAPEWDFGAAPQSDSCGSAITTLHLAWTLTQAAELMDYAAHTTEASTYRSLAQRLCKAVYTQCWDSHRGLLRDYIGSPTFSQQANIMGILSNAIPQRDQRAVFERIVTEDSITQTTFYYKFYLIRAMNKVGLADRYISMLGPWRAMIATGLSTFAETPEPTRSDCHAWSASPNYDLLATVCGITPSAPGFATVRVAPAPGPLHHIRGTVPHPKGLICVDLHRVGKRLEGHVTLPEGVEGTYLWQGRKSTLHTGINTIR